MRGQVFSGPQPTWDSVELPNPCDVAKCSLDDPGLVPPDDHVWCHRMVRWLKLADEPPRHRLRRADA